MNYNTCDVVICKAGQFKSRLVANYALLHIFFQSFFLCRFLISVFFFLLSHMYTYPFVSLLCSLTMITCVYFNVLVYHSPPRTGPSRWLPPYLQRRSEYPSLKYTSTHNTHTHTYTHTRTHIHCTHTHIHAHTITAIQLIEDGVCMACFHHHEAFVERRQGLCSLVW